MVFDSPEIGSLRSSRHRSPGYDRIIETTTTKRSSDDGHYGGINKIPQRTLSPTNTSSINRNERYITETRTINNEVIPHQRTLSPGGRNEHYITETRTINNEIIPAEPVVKNDRYYTETRTINNEIIPAAVPKNVVYNEVVRLENETPDLRDLQLSPEILPKPKTKVTTTVRTYTYEIPEPETANQTQTVIYNNDNSIVTYPPDRDPPKTNAVLYKQERTQRSVNYYPNQPNQPNQPQDAYPPLTIQEVPTQPPQNTTTVYRYDVTNTTNTTSPQNIPPGGITVYPPPPTQTTIVYKTDTHHVNQKYRSPTPTNYYPDRNTPYPSGHPTHPIPHPQQQPQNNLPSHPADPSVIVYKHTTTTNTRNIISPRHEREPLLHPFPNDGPTITEVDGNPPKHLHDLMATFGDVSRLS